MMWEMKFIAYICNPNEVVENGILITNGALKSFVHTNL
jgi:hypothetical protein